MLRATLPGTTVVIKGTTKGTVTNVDGNYTIDANSDATLVFSFVGYQTQEVEINGRNTININFTQSSIGLDEVVAIGYGQRSKGALTGAVGTTTGKILEKTATSNMQQALQGRIPGLIITDRGGAPGNESLNMLIRGSQSFNDNNPLIVINGVPRSMDDFRYLSSQDIENISVLKDASAAIYGARAANGVILVQTKSGRKGQEAQFKVHTEYRLSQATKKSNHMNSYQRAQYENEGAAYSGFSKPWSDQEIQHFKLGDNPLYPNTNWFDEIVKPVTPEWQTNLSASGSTDKTQYYISIDYLNKEGLLSSNDLNYKQWQATSNFSVQVTRDLKLGTNLRVQSSKRIEPWIANPFAHNLVGQEPWLIPRWPNGLLGTAGPGGVPLALIDRDLAGKRDFWKSNYYMQFDFDYDMSWLTNGLTFSGYAAFDRSYSRQSNLKSPYTFYTYDPVTDTYSGHVNDPGQNFIELNVERGSSGLDFYNVKLDYKNNFGLHNVAAFAAFEQNQTFLHTISGRRRNLPSTSQPYLWAGDTGTGLMNGESYFETARINYFGSLHYNYASKYLLDFTLRRDGSYNFPKEGRFGIFPGFSAGYVISQESFMSGFSSWLDQLKLRVSYAKMGSDNTAPFQYLSSYGYGWSIPFGKTPVIANGYKPYSGGIRSANPNITWESSYQQNYGLNLVVLKGKLDLSVDYFVQKRRDMLLPSDVQVPQYSAIVMPDMNFGKVDNRGIEFALNYTDKIGEVNIFGGLNYTYVKNEIIEIAEPTDVPEWRKQEGSVIGSFNNVYDAIGIYKSIEEVNSTPHLPGAQPGDIILRDVDGDGTITGNDRIRVHESIIPEIQYGFNLGAEYKGFSIEVFFNGQANATVSMHHEDFKFTDYIFERRWTPENPNAEYPRSYYEDDVLHQFSTFWLRDASYLRLKNVSLAYDLPKSLLSKLKLSGVNVFVQGRNLMVWDKIKEYDFDPEKGNGFDPYPQTRTYSIGTTINF
jgi:TonB-dependent starch-binding outer membrane protein SusC